MSSRFGFRAHSFACYRMFGFDWPAGRTPAGSWSVVDRIVPRHPCRNETGADERVKADGVSSSSDATLCLGPRLEGIARSLTGALSREASRPCTAAWIEERRAQGQTSSELYHGGPTSTDSLERLDLEKVVPLSRRSTDVGLGQVDRHRDELFHATVPDWLSHVGERARRRGERCGPRRTRTVSSPFGGDQRYHVPDTWVTLLRSKM